MNGVKNKLQHGFASDITVVKTSNSCSYLAEEFWMNIKIGDVTKEGRIFFADNHDSNGLSIENMFDPWLGIKLGILVNVVQQRPDETST